jgi:hypothetical protein
MIHKSSVIEEHMLEIVNDPPVTNEKNLRGQYISILFCREYDETFTKNDFPNGVYLFDIGKIQSVKPDTKCDDGERAIVKVKYDKDVYPVTLHLNEYASDKVKVAERQHQWRLLSSLSTSDASSSLS